MIVKPHSNLKYLPRKCLKSHFSSHEKVDVVLIFAYYVGMNDVQYTIRSVPRQLDASIRRDARRLKMSLNKTVLKYIEDGVNRSISSGEEDFSWLIGSNSIEDVVLDEIKAAKDYDKQKQRHSV